MQKMNMSERKPYAERKSRMIVYCLKCCILYSIVLSLFEKWRRFCRSSFAASRM